MPVGTAFHERSFPLAESLQFRDWAGYYAAASYEPYPEHEYAAIRNTAALIDVSPLFKYSVRGPDAAALIQRTVTRDVSRLAVGQMLYCCWCDDEGKILDDGTIARLDETSYRWTAAEANLRWFRMNAAGLRVDIEDVSESLAALALQGPLAARILAALVGDEILQLRYYRIQPARIARAAVEISRTGYTGDLGYELWIPRPDALAVWDALMDAGRPFGLRPAGLLALDVARIEAGLLLNGVEYVSSRRALNEDQRYSPFELGLDRLVVLEKDFFVGRNALLEERRRGGPRRRLVGLEVDWAALERVHLAADLPPQLPPTASRVSVPVYRGSRQVGRATSSTWSPVLKKFIALASLQAGLAQPGQPLEFEFTLEGVHHRLPARVVPLPFFSPARKTATPPPDR